MLDDNYQVTAEKLLDACDKNTKAIWICSPNNPTGNNINRDEIIKVVEQFDGLVIVDEAYIDFSREITMSRMLNQYPNLIVLQTLSKAWGSAAIRLGMAFASKDIISIYNKVKYPYNVNLLTQQQALNRLNNTYDVEQWVKLLLQERSRMIEAFGELKICDKVYPTDANFFLAKVVDAQKIYDYLVDNGIIVRNRTRVSLCQNCLRITIGTREENNELLGALRNM
jgi:histidinol-phosphate aminotransferase